METMVRFVHTAKQYGEKKAVRGLDLEIAAGELFVLVGPNGAGKTTALKMLAGLLKPTSGKIIIGGFDAEKEAEQAKRLISFVPDTPYVYEKLTPRELMRFVGKLYGLPVAAIETRTRELLAFFSLEHVRDVLIEEFSHGMRQKAVLAAALIHGPSLFVLDEPMVGLDPMSIRSFKDFLREKSREGMTIILSTHTLSMAEELGERIGVIHRGELIALGTLAGLQARYGSSENLETMFMKLVGQEEPKTAP